MKVEVSKIILMFWSVYTSSRYWSLMYTHWVCEGTRKDIVIASGYSPKYVSKWCLFVFVELADRVDVPAIRKDLWPFGIWSSLEWRNNSRRISKGQVAHQGTRAIQSWLETTVRPWSFGWANSACAYSQSIQGRPAHSVNWLVVLTTIA